MTGDRDAPDRDGAHEEFEAQAVGWAMHALEPAEAQSFGAHLAGCDRCERVVEETRAVMVGMAGAVPAASPPDRLRARLQAAVRDTRQLPAPDRPASTGHGGRPGPAQGAVLRRGRHAADRRPPRRTLTAVLVAAAAAGLAGFGVGQVVPGGAREEARTQAAIVERLLDGGEVTLVPVVDGDGDEVATVVAREDALQVVAHGMAANDPADTTYVLWGLDGGSPRALGTFDVAGEQPELRTVADEGPGPGLAGYGISLEPGRQAPPAPTEVVATGEVPA